MAIDYEELYDKFCNWYEDDGSYDEHFLSEIESILEKEISERLKNQAETKWISVKERLPIEYERVLIYNKDEFGVRIFSGYFYEGDAKDDSLDICKATHWQPLPEPPSK